ncbi:MAG: type II toxin-antitoxin system prevent-host-death family antitoxin [Clostridiales Family XIII bacterium]|jgi:prevent-host-death family protein|nr:type II toxin-antitoxin system prevent-host-death family antitoxin [Clostridiales Family XIII bacterium]
MLQQVNIHEAKTHLSRLVEDVSRGKPYVIAKAGKPVAMLVPYTPEKKTRVGFYKGEMTIPEDFDRFAEKEIAELFGAEI